MGLMRRLSHLAEYAAVRTALEVDRLVGPTRASRGAAALARFAYRPLGIRAAVVEAHLRQAFPDRDEEWIRRTAVASYEHLGREGLTMLRLSRLGPADILAITEPEGDLPAMQAAVAAGRGAILAAGHLGNWEIGGAGLAARGLPMDVVVQRQANPYFDRLINDARARLGMTVIPRGGATKAALRSLRRGRVVALVADQDARATGLFVPFLGRPASTHRGPAVLALRSGAALFAASAVRVADGTYRLRIREVPVPEEGEFDEQVRLLTVAVTRALEAAVRRDPEQYFWHHRRWKTAPPEVVEAVGNGGRGGAV
jgi:Kdo2-lipid IVA lauroyltransferase/acyltransferase